jgi:uncharacterized membrane protein YkoI
MRQKSFIISIFVTLFILGVVAGIARATYIVQHSPSYESPQMKLTLAARDAQYNQTITDANNRIEQANLILQQIQQKLEAQQANIAQSASQPVVPAAAPTPAQPDVSASTPQTGVSSNDATKIALDAAKDWITLADGNPDKVDYQGKAAYEVKFAYDAGTMYIDALDGSVLYDSLTDSSNGVITEDQASKAAMDYMKSGSVSTVQRTLFNGKPAYRVIFNTGHHIYVGVGGDILFVEIHSVVVNYVSGGGGGSGSGSKGGGSGSSSSSSSAPAPAQPSRLQSEGGSGHED